MVVVVFVAVMVIVLVMMVSDPAGECPPDQHQAHAGHEQAGDEAQPELQAGPQRGVGGLVEPDDQAKRDHQCGVGDGDDDGQYHRVPVIATAADEIGGDDGLGVAGHERVGGAPDEGEGGDGQKDHEAPAALKQADQLPGLTAGFTHLGGIVARIENGVREILRAGEAGGGLGFDIPLGPLRGRGRKLCSGCLGRRGGLCSAPFWR